MEGAVRQTTRLHRPAMPWGLLAGLEVLALALLSGWLVLDLYPSAFDLHWGCVSSSGELHSSADTYIAVFAVGGALGWLVAAAATAIAHASGKRRVAAVIPIAWFALLSLGALAVAQHIGPITC
jgi:hypothetical protein